MYHMVQIHVSKDIAAPANRVWAILDDVSTWASWGPFDESRIESPGRSHVNSVGSIRAFRVGRTRSREQVVAYEPGRSFSYILLSGLPLKDYRADVTVTDLGAGSTRLEWRSRFRGPIPGTGWIYAKMLQVFLGKIVRAADAAVAAPVA
jgi:hypothetical protein